MPWLAKKVGLKARFAHDDCCVWCQVPRDKLGSNTSHATRTSDRMRSNSHLPPIDPLDPTKFIPFTCERCGYKFSSKEEWAAEDQTSDADSKLFTKVHAGHVWHRASLVTEPQRLIMCQLHMRLSFMNSLWRWLIYPSAAVKRPDIAERVLKMLQKDGVNIWRLKQMNTSSEEATRNASFTGGAADKVMSRLGEYLTVVESREYDKG